MRIRTLAPLALLILGAACGSALSPAAANQQQTNQQQNRSGRPDVFDVEAGDAQMAAAAARARAELPDFYRRLANPGPDEHNFGVKFDLGGTGEMIWAGELRRENGRLSGILNNVPINPDYRQGQRVEFEESAIIDWAYFRGRVAQGHYTTRVILDRLPADQAEGIRAALGW